MNAQTPFSIFSARSLVLLAVAAISLLLGSQSAAALTTEYCDYGFPGSGCVEVAARQSAPMLVGSGPEREEVAHSDNLIATVVGSESARDEVAIAATLVGSGPEREEVAHSQAAVAATLVGSGPEREEVAQVQAQASSSDESAFAGIGPSA